MAFPYAMRDRDVPDESETQQAGGGTASGPADNRDRHVKPSHGIGLFPTPGAALNFGDCRSHRRQRVRLIA